MSRLPLLTAKDLIKILLKLGFELKRQKGSHKFVNIKMAELLLSQIMVQSKLTVAC
jgi:predicted RNA binding protein YcfA (HicA-like mRNA interferase family)